MAKNLKLERRVKSKQERVKALLLEHLGGAGNVTEIYYNKKRSYAYRCLECGVIISDKLAQQLQVNHNYSQRKTMLLQTKMRVVCLWCLAEKLEMSLPIPCLVCGKWQLRLDQHLKRGNNGMYVCELQSARNNPLSFRRSD